MKSLLFFTIYLYCIFFFEDVLCKKRGHHGTTKGGKIVGGSEVSIDKFPYQAHLTVQTDNGTFGCGGSIISDTYILTAAHCLPRPKNIIITVGSEYADDGDLSVSNDFKIHPKYNAKTKDNDVGLVRLTAPLTFGEKIKPISLPRKGAPIVPHTEVTVSGWGATSENGQGSDVLMAVIVPTLSISECRKSYNLTENMFCAGVSEVGKDSCQGDSGGPAVANNEQIGIVSFGVGCARPKYPGVYARVASPVIRMWIKQISGV